MFGKLKQFKEIHKITIAKVLETPQFNQCFTMAMEMLTKILKLLKIMRIIGKLKKLENKRKHENSEHQKIMTNMKT